MDLTTTQKKVVVSWVNYLLNRLFNEVDGDRDAVLRIQHSLNIQGAQIAAWRVGRNLPNAATLYHLADAAGVLTEITEAFENAPGLQHLPKLLPETMKSDV